MPQKILGSLKIVSSKILFRILIQLFIHGEYDHWSSFHIITCKRETPGCNIKKAKRTKLVQQQKFLGHTQKTM